MNREKKLIEDIIMSLVDDKDGVKINCTLTEHTAVYDIYVAKKDFPVVMGKKGSHVVSLRTLFKAIYGKMGKRLHLQVIDPRRIENK